MNPKKILLSLSFLFVLLSLTGCWGKRELNEIALVSGLAIDPSEEGYEITIQVMVPAEIGGKTKTSASDVKTFSETGKSVFQAIRKMTMDMPRKAYFTHLMVVVIDEAFAKNDMLEIIDLLIRDTEIRPNTPILISKDNKAKDILKILTNIETIPANKVRKSVLNMDTSWMSTPWISFYDLVSSMASDGINPAPLGVSIIGELEKGEKNENVEQIDAPARIEVQYYGVFKDNKLIGWMDEYESIGYNYLTGKVQSTLLSAPCDESNTYNLEVYQAKSKGKVKIEEGKPVVYITYQAVTRVAEIGCNIDLSKPEEIDKLKQKFKEEVIKNAKYTLEKLQEEYKSDIIGIGEMIHRQKPKLWKSLKDDWDSHFETTEVVIDAKFEIKGVGTINGKLIEKLRK